MAHRFDDCKSVTIVLRPDRHAKPTNESVEPRNDAKRILYVFFGDYDKFAVFFLTRHRIQAAFCDPAMLLNAQQVADGGEATRRRRTNLYFWQRKPMARIFFEHAEYEIDERL